MATLSRTAFFALGGVAHKPWRDPLAEAALRGQRAKCGDVRSRGRCAAARRQRLMRTTPSRSISRAAVIFARAHASRAAARRSRSRPRRSPEHDHGALHRHTHIPRRRLREGHRRSAQYAAEFDAPGLVYGSVVTSTIAKGRIARIELCAALRVEGVLDVLTHENRRSMPDNDQAYKDDVAPQRIAVPAAL